MQRHSDVWLELVPDEAMHEGLSLEAGRVMPEYLLSLSCGSGTEAGGWVQGVEHWCWPV